MQQLIHVQINQAIFKVKLRSPMSIKIWPLMIFMAAVAVRWNFSFYFMMARSVAEKYWLSEIARKESRFLSTGLRTAGRIYTSPAATHFHISVMRLWRCTVFTGFVINSKSFVYWLRQVRLQSHNHTCLFDRFLQIKQGTRLEDS